MDKIISILLGIGILLGVIFMPILVQATETSTTSIQELIQTIKQQIEELKTQIELLSVQIESLRQAKGEVKETVKEIKRALKITRQLWRGVSNEDVELLQEVLATDPDIYPEGLITGYFGPLTEKAVKKFQDKMGVEQVGVVGPKTMAKINELLEEGAGASGKVPPGLLIAPGIRKKLSFEPQPLPGQELPPGISKKLGEEEEEDTTAPVISEVTSASTTATSTLITWITDEEADSKVYYDTSTPLIISTSTPVKSSSELIENHEITLTDLTASTTYYYIVTSADDSDNIATSDEYSFTTLSE